ncbi:MAG: hypothetical protein HQL44_05395 [Alphaproteobacteria bacterium]|nr:hypothetical protein [Alphaproteobacteria bacterium]
MASLAKQCGIKKIAQVTPSGTFYCFTLSLRTHVYALPFHMADSTGNALSMDTRPLAVDYIHRAGALRALIVRSRATPDQTTFLTEDDALFQAGFIVYAAGGAVAPHYHKPVERQISGTCEAILVRSGSCHLDLYGDDLKCFATRELHAGDLVVLYGGGHGFRMIEDCTLFEIKQGPYGGLQEKERFIPIVD